MNPTTNACPDDDTIAAFASAQLPAEARAAVRVHLESCPSCHDLLGQLARLDAVRVSNTVSNTGDARARDATTLSPGDRLDGYMLRRRLDAGAMGEVWVADDSALDRQVAVKVLRGTASDDETEGLLRREARSLAQLSHPNVVTVHGVSRWEGRDYIAMEYVSGTNLSDWLAASKPTLGERIDAMIQAGRGLAAAHKAGIIHRDFKPSNVLMGSDGRVRVGDFGLARLRRAEAAAGPAPGDTSAATSIAGTPAYMAPEQLGGGAATEAGDQFSFAVSLHEAVHGQRPFAGATPGELIASIQKGPPPTPRAPGWLRTILVRGLSADPKRRFESVDALVEALEAGRRRRRRALIGVSMVAVAAVTAGVAVPLALDAASGPGCQAEGAAMAKIWNPARQEAIRAKLEAVAGKAGAEQWLRAVPIFDDYARQWSKMQRETCEATRVRHVQSDGLHDRRMFCLDRRLAQVDHLAGSLADVKERSTALKVVEIARGLPALAPCADTRWISESPLPSPEARPAIDAAFKELDAVRALNLEGKFQDGLTAARKLDETAVKLDFAPLVADLAFELADLADHAADFDLARAQYDRASSVAARLGRTDRVFEAQVKFVRMESHQEHYDLARGRAGTLETLARLSGEPMHLAMQHESLADIYEGQGKYPEAVKEYREALTLLPPGAKSEIRESQIRQGLGLVLMNSGEYEPAEVELNKTLALREKIYGPDHPRIAQAVTNLGNLEWHRGHPAKALEKWQKALDIQEKVSNGEDPDIALTVGNVAIAQQALGKLEDALVSLDRALVLRKKFYGPEHTEVAKAMSNKALLLGKMGRYAEARALVLEGIAIREKVQGKDHPDLVRALVNFGEVLGMEMEVSEGEAARAAAAASIEPLSRAIEIGNAKLKPGHNLIGSAHLHRADARRVLGQLPEAIADGERGLAIFAKKYDAKSDAMVMSATVLAEALLAGGQTGKAIEVLEAQLDKKAEIESFDQARAFFLLARAYRRAHREPEALAMAEKSIKEGFDDSKDAEARVYSKKAHAFLGK